VVGSKGLKHTSYLLSYRGTCIYIKQKTFHFQISKQNNFQNNNNNKKKKPSASPFFYIYIYKQKKKHFTFKFQNKTIFKKIIIKKTLSLSLLLPLAKLKKTPYSPFFFLTSYGSPRGVVYYSTTCTWRERERESERKR
jgi:hypothetical protein